MKYSIGYNNSFSLLKKINNFCKENNISKNNVEFFCGAPFYKTSLNRFYNENISIKNFEKSILLGKKYGFEFNYLMNSKIIKSYSDIDKEIIWLKGLGINILTISDLSLIEYINNNYANFEIVVSIITGIKNKIDLLKLSKFKNIKRIIFHQSVNHKFKNLIGLIYQAKKLGFETELLANELCYSDCELRDEHYLQISKYNGISCDFFDKLGNFCVEERKNISIVNNSPWIRSEDVIIYEKIGLDYIKLAGRNCEDDILLNAIKAYLLGKYNGNFFDLMDLDGKKGGGRIENRKLDNNKLNGVLYNKFLKELKGKD